MRMGQALGVCPNLCYVILILYCIIPVTNERRIFENKILQRNRSSLQCWVAALEITRRFVPIFRRSTWPAIRFCNAMRYSSTPEWSPFRKRKKKSRTQFVPIEFAQLHRKLLPFENTF